MQSQIDILQSTISHIENSLNSLARINAIELEVITSTQSLLSEVEAALLQLESTIDFVIPNQ